MTARKVRSPKDVRLSVADVLDLYANTAGLWLQLGSIDENDVQAAAQQAVDDGAIENAESPFRGDEGPAIVDRLVGIARQRRPRYLVGVIDFGEIADSITGAVPIAFGTVGIVLDPEGRAGSLDDAVQRFRGLVGAESITDDVRLAALDRMQGKTVLATARRRGLSKRAMQDRRATVRDHGVDPDTGGPAVP